MPSTLPKAVRDLTQELTRLPGIGPKTAQRLAIHLLRQPSVSVGRLASILKNLHLNVRICRQCFNLSEKELCRICSDSLRDATRLCIVEDPLDVEAIERTNVYHGLYHVLGGTLSPLDGIGPEQLTLGELVKRLSETPVEELIIALDQNLEGEATTRHILHSLPAGQTGLPSKNITVTRLARGLPTGGDIEFADATTLGAAFEGRKVLNTVPTPATL